MVYLNPDIVYSYVEQVLDGIRKETDCDIYSTVMPRYFPMRTFFNVLGIFKTYDYYQHHRVLIYIDIDVPYLSRVLLEYDNMGKELKFLTMSFLNKKYETAENIEEMEYLAEKIRIRFANAFPVIKNKKEEVVVTH